MAHQLVKLTSTMPSETYPFFSRSGAWASGNADGRPWGIPSRMFQKKSSVHPARNDENEGLVAIKELKEPFKKLGRLPGDGVIF
ncbi:hypothetical protein CEXT_506471 [Caerostris extrusa]|uniref:Uncharacterized protein n=1 Tax=Caerostris extrusa TaxID=172846 RepID=A0AAV4QPN0_CAEEX|nr:hypothetical protein CEXT_506471 [Caerostris extrusa]